MAVEGSSTRRIGAKAFALLCSIALFLYAKNVQYSRHGENQGEPVEQQEHGVVGRSLLSIASLNPDKSCNVSFTKEYQQEFGIIIFPIYIIYICCGLALVCEGGFQASLMAVGQALRIPPNIAGATFMAAGTSSPELFIALLALGQPDDAMGMGTVVGSVVFNVLMIVGACAVFAPAMVCQVRWQTILRDVVWNAIAFTYLLGAFWDQKITLAEAFIGLILYFVYCFVIFQLGRIYNFTLYVLSFCGMDEKFASIIEMEMVERHTTELDDPVAAAGLLAHEDHHDLVTDDDYFPYTTGEDNFTDRDDYDAAFSTRNEKENQFYSSDDAYDSDSAITMARLSNEELDSHRRAMFSADTTNHDDEFHQEIHEESYLHWPDSIPLRIFYVITIPFRVLFFLTVPRIRLFGYYTFILTFINSLIWLALLSYCMVLFVNKFGCAIGLSDFEEGQAIMGLTFLAVGTSMPDCLTSIFVARSGELEMAVSNALGSNIFDILLALTIPWILECSIFSETGSVIVENATLKRDIFIMFLVIIAFKAILIVNKFRITKLVGLILVIMYGFFVTYSVLSELQIIPF
mmetsp:Transcript_22311/g.62650  ORF Transcript_22311/g.62650 Transcript_22311/m.62650 type:complete len:575 (+) Transcript_22311:37-1761(+)|eukprot:CAMPEP_0119131608 /NCGR_PEP_ID=MMETSP1310-20130426/10473_1 /TAXON_ID=464262 /ORGANISM="Genus nov. species nov., Strain RCC2339" /LENGTH=574 /DNA_ID=CAMNT_0007122193 /DNA_START=37 /DNA_END=1761 /DNA_ORIENTATION=+